MTKHTQESWSRGPGRPFGTSIGRGGGGVEIKKKKANQMAVKSGKTLREKRNPCPSFHRRGGSRRVSEETKERKEKNTTERGTKKKRPNPGKRAEHHLSPLARERSEQRGRGDAKGETEKLKWWLGWKKKKREPARRQETPSSLTGGIWDKGDKRIATSQKGKRKHQEVMKRAR